MKFVKQILILCISIFAVFSCEKQKNMAADKVLLDLLVNKNFFKLQTELKNVQNQLSDDRLLYYKMHCAQAFGNSWQSNKHADMLLDMYSEKLNDTLMVDVLNVKSINYMRAYNYKDAAKMHRRIFDKYQNVLDSAEIEVYKNSYAMFDALSEVKPQQIHKHGDIEIKAGRNKFRHLMIPVKCGGIADEFIFDSGANISTITDSCAKKMGLTIYQTDITVGTSTDIDIEAQLAVADSLHVGDILFENVVFLVAPAEQMTFKEFDYEIHGIIGFPVFFQMGEICMQQDGTITVHREPQNRELNNMFLDGLVPVVQVLTDNDTLLCNFDTGATSSDLSKQYYDRHQSEIHENGILDTIKRGGAGGIVQVETYKLHNFNYRIGNSTGTLPEINVSLQDYDFNKFDGNIGQDIINQHNKLIINFSNMYINFE